MNWWPLAMSAAIFLLVVPTGVYSRRSHRAQSFKISPKPCRVDGEHGTCMFVWECVKGGGRHLGMCVDDFMFGTCCTNSSSPSSTERPALVHFPGEDTASVVSGIVHSGYRPPPRPTGAPHLVTSGLRPPSPPFAHFVTSASFSTPFYHSPTSLSKHTAWYHRPTSPSPVRTTPKPPTTVNRRPPVTTTRKPTTTTTTTEIPTTTTRTTTTTRRPPTTTTRRYPTTTTRRPPTTRRPQATTRRPTSTTRRPTTRWPPVTTTRRSSTTTQRPTERTTTRPMTASPHFSSSAPPHFITRPKPPPSPPLWANRPRPQQGTTTTKKTPTALVIKRPSGTTKRPIAATKRPATTAAPTTSKPTTTTTPKSTTSPVTVSLVGSGSTWKECGVTTFHPRPETRIVGGKNAAFGGWPWQVSVRRTSFFGFSSTHRCGGAVLNENWIATAGHCVDDLLTSQIRIRVGEHDFSKTGSESGDSLQQLRNGDDLGEPLSHVERGVARKVVHPRYNFFTYEYDLALVRLSEPLPPPSAAPHVAPICLPGSDDLLVGENATVTGWGRLSEGGTLPSVLQQVTVPIVSNEKCKSMFLRAGRHEFIPDIFLCAGYEEGGRDSCQGDSGGPLQVRGKDGRYFLAGIISWGIGCAEANLPGVCTRISKFVDWILENVT